MSILFYYRYIIYYKLGILLNILGLLFYYSRRS